MKFIIRDDDTCAFTKPEDLHTCYREIWDDIPINLSVTPYRIPGNSTATPQEYAGQNKPLPLGENKELVSFLTENQAQKRLHFALHGYYHTKPNYLPEYIGGTDLKKKTAEGKSYLEKTLNCTISTFIPPNNGIAINGLLAVVENRMNLIGIPPILKGKYRRVHIQNISKYLRTAFYTRIKGCSQVF